MKINRSSLVSHLQHVSCGGQVAEVVFNGKFEAVALTPDHHLLVLAPALPKRGAAALSKEPIGISDLGLLIKALSALAGEGNEALKVDVRFDDHRLVIDEGHRGLLRLLTAKPKTISTYIEDDIRKKLLAKAPKTDKGIALTRSLVEGIRNTFSMLKVTEVELFLGPKGGKVRLGSETSHIGEFPSEELKARKSFSMLFGEHLVNVLGAVSNYAEATLCLGATAEDLVMITDGDYKYLLSPRTRRADEVAPTAATDEE